ncbi:MAG: ATP-dependent DNA helicase RecG [Candidatus Obscuribacterales bacterium]|nr:ATP-dependent DNA helicase RecG [Candidatus Obscuribacterales bacterium]
MSPIVGQGKPSKDSLVIAMRKALNVERRSRYADFHGRRSTFSQFMRQTSASLSRTYPMDSTWITIRGLFRQYPHTDVATRISIIKRAEELIEPHLDVLMQRKPLDEESTEVASDEERGIVDEEIEDNVASGVVTGGSRDRTNLSGADLSPAGGALDERREATRYERSGAAVESSDIQRTATGSSSGRERGGLGAIKGLGVKITPVVDGQPVVGARSSKARSNQTDNSDTPNQANERGNGVAYGAASGGRSGYVGDAGGSAGRVGNSGASTGSPAARSGAVPNSFATGAGQAANRTGRPNSLENGRSVSGSPPPSATSGTRPTGPARAKDAAGKDPEEVHVQFVKGVGPKLAGVLNRLEINTVSELLRHYPRRHLDFQNRLLIRDLNQGQEVTIFGMIRSVGAFQSRKRNVSVLTVVISDNTGSITITKFVGGKSNKYLLDRYKAQYPKGAQVLASGIVERDQYSGKFTLKNSEVEILGLVSDGEEDQQQVSIHAGRLVPVYPLTEGLSLRYLRTIMHNALEAYAPYIQDPLPREIRDELGLVELTEALRGIHFPSTVEEKDSARRRLVFDELFAIQLQLAHRRHKFDHANNNALALKYSEEGLVRELVMSLPFRLTGAQERVFGEIARDLASNKPMHRLVQGDVGSGKTVVALLACLIAIENGYQAAMMAPTEILAEQHFRQFQRLLTPLGLRTCLVLGKHGVKERRAVRQQILSGQVHVAVGTHALLEDDVEFPNLGLIIIDEQHRFGVKQRARLKAKSLSPELLTMTATPIPRTLAMTMHGDLDVSEIDELPPGRKPVITKVGRPGQKDELWNFIIKEIDKGRQAYIVFPLIEESESLSAKAATKEFEKLQQKFGEEDPARGKRKIAFGLMHGKLKAQEKDKVMEQFRKGEFQVLVSTTVIEVGVDVPNASVMVIENADRFGLAQLHQLRGRVGRGAEQSYCFLISDMKSSTTRERLEIMTLTNDGFVVAEKDLEIRGPGEFLGYRQSGLPDLILADLVQDAKILEEARHTAISLVKADPELKNAAGLRALLERRSSSGEAETMRSG